MSMRGKVVAQGEKHILLPGVRRVWRWACAERSSQHGVLDRETRAEVVLYPVAVAPAVLSVRHKLGKAFNSFVRVWQCFDYGSFILNKLKLEAQEYIAFSNIWHTRS